MHDHQPSAAAHSAAASTEAARHCFVVDDDAGICKALAFTLRRLGYETAEIPSPAALEVEIAKVTPELIFLDLGLGQSGAQDVLPILERHHYSGMVQLMSGRSEDVLQEFVASGEQHGLKMLPPLPKPFRMGVVKELVASLQGTA